MAMVNFFLQTCLFIRVHFIDVLTGDGLQYVCHTRDLNAHMRLLRIIVEANMLVCARKFHGHLISAAFFDSCLLSHFLGP